MARPICGNCSCPMERNNDYCYVCDAMRTAVAESGYLRQIQEKEEQERCAARRRMGLEGE